VKKFILVSIIFCLTLIPSMGFGHELLVLSSEKSQNSKRWEKEVLPEYKVSNLGQNLPVKIVLVKESFFPDWFAKALDDGSVGEIIGTPTFLIWDPKEKKEVGRIEGYTQKSRFFSQLTEAIDLVKQGQHPGKREGSGGHRDEGSGGGHRMDEGSGGHRDEGSGGGHRMDEGSGGHRDEGSGNKNNIMDHIYKTPEEAKKASQILGLGGKIHTHETADGTIYMPGSTM
jgi:hypothetical protein